MTCDNKVSYHVKSHHNNYREIFVRCGRTNPFGHRAICERCEASRTQMAKIRRAEANIKADNDAAHSAGWGDF